MVLILVPTIGMLCGNAISAIVVATDAVLRELECVAPML